MKHILTLLVLWALSFTAQATDRYYCKCDTGAHPSCAAGNNANSGLSAALAKADWPSETDIGSAVAGDRFLFCAGGSWTGQATIQIENLVATPSNPITFTSYAPSSGATGRPIRESTADTIGILFGSYENTSDDKGYVFRGMRFTSATPTTQPGMQIFGRLSYVTWDDIVLENYYIGFSIVSNQPVAFLKLINSTVQNNAHQGFLGTANDLVIENNVFTGNHNDGCGGLCHAMYLGGQNGASRITVRNNVLTNNSMNGGVCTGGNITVHGQLDQMVIEGNVISVTAPSASCGGIAIRAGYTPDVESFTRGIIRGNTVVNTGFGMIFVDFGPSVLVENNKLIGTVAYDQEGIQIVQNPEDAVTANTVIRNNTCYFTGATTAANACLNMSQNTGHTVINNLAYIGSAAAMRCYNQQALANYATWNYNHCYRAGSGAYSNLYSTLALAQAAGFDVNGSQGDPLFNTTPTSGNGWDLSLQAGSPAVGTGTNINAPPRDVLYCVRKNPPDKGAYDRGATPCQTVKSPVYIR